jgi:hypothetical protein
MPADLAGDGIGIKLISSVQYPYHISGSQVGSQCQHHFAPGVRRDDQLDLIADGIYK